MDEFLNDLINVLAIGFMVFASIYFVFETIPAVIKLSSKDKK